MEKNEKLLNSILMALSNAGILQDLILIGGWCQRMYRYIYNNPPEISALRTVDIDFLIPDPEKLSREINIMQLFKPFDLE